MKIRHKTSNYCTLTDDEGNRMADDVAFDRLAGYLMKKLTLDQQDEIERDIRINQPFLD